MAEAGGANSSVKSRKAVLVFDLDDTIVSFKNIGDMEWEHAGISVDPANFDSTNEARMTAWKQSCFNQKILQILMTAHIERLDNKDVVIFLLTNNSSKDYIRYIDKYLVSIIGGAKNPSTTISIDKKKVEVKFTSNFFDGILIGNSKERAAKLNMSKLFEDVEHMYKQLDPEKTLDPTQVYFFDDQKGHFLSNHEGVNFIHITPAFRCKGNAIDQWGEDNTNFMKLPEWLRPPKSAAETSAWLVENKPAEGRVEAKPQAITQAKSRVEVRSGAITQAKSSEVHPEDRANYTTRRPIDYYGKTLAAAGFNYRVGGRRRKSRRQRQRQRQRQRSRSLNHHRDRRSKRRKRSTVRNK